jgi:hypothetical protein
MHHPIREREASNKRTGYIQTKVAPGVCCDKPSCTRRIKNTKCENCGKDCKGCKFA